MGSLKIAVAGQGAFGVKHLEGIQNIPDIEVVTLAGGSADTTSEVAERFGIGHWTTDFDESIRRDDVEAVILATPTQMHASQAVAALQAGKHVEIEIPLADSLEDARAVQATQSQTGLVAMVGHTRRFNPSHQWIHKRVESGELELQHLVVETFFFRRTNTNAAGQPRSWTDHLLWHHAAHTVDLFGYQSNSDIVDARALQGPPHPDLGIAMDMSIALQSASGALCTLSLSFNNDGPFGTTFRYICDKGTFVARYDDLETGAGAAVDLSGVAVSDNGIELQDREFLAAITEGREPNASVDQIMPTMVILDQIEQSLTQ